MNEIPVYLFSGFLEAGKTSMIQRALENKDFSSGEKTLLLVCEEGIEEYDPTAFADQDVQLETVDNEVGLTTEYLKALEDAYHMTRVVIEYNGMWQLNQIFRVLPENWLVFQEIFVADASTILNYNANMRQMVVDKLQSCDLVVFNRMSDSTDKMPLHKLVRAISRRADIEYDFPDGRAEQDDIEDPLPFDLNAPIVEIADVDYAIWYQDLMEDMEKYNGKTVRFKGFVVTNATFPIRTFAVGRQLMTCCAADVQFAGLIAKWKRASSLRERDWVIVTAEIKLEDHKLYGRRGPVLYVTAVEYAQKPEQEIASFY